MPQVRCPNCGETINLENRKETDFSLILGALHSHERSFSELLRVTGLPRKTLNNRLKELCVSDAVVKNKLYYLSEANPYKGLERKIMYGNSKIFQSKRAIVMLMLLCVSIPITGRLVMAMLVPGMAPPAPVGYVTTVVSLKDAPGVYGWQIGVQFNDTNLKLIEITPGDFLTGADQNLIIIPPQDQQTSDTKAIYFARMVEDGTWVVCQTLTGNVEPKSGSGTLAVLRFACYYQPTEMPTLAYDIYKGYNTMLLRMDTSEIANPEQYVSIYSSLSG